MEALKFDASRYQAPIIGWCADEIFFALEAFFRSEEPFSQPGPICEIGVHHGRFLIGAHNALGGTRALGIDLFEHQERNVDGSGEGSREMLRAAMAHAVNSAQIDARQDDSLGLGLREIDEILTRYGRFKVFSVDGGHTPEHVTNDMRIAQELTAQDGLILVDDFFSPHWPGVTEGLSALFQSRQCRFAPFLYLENKLFLTGISCRERALEHTRIVIEALKGHIEFRPVTFFGYRCWSGVRYAPTPAGGA